MSVPISIYESILERLKNLNKEVNESKRFEDMNKKSIQKMVDSGEWRDEEHPQKWELGLDAAYLDEASEFIKLNYNCPAEEKQGIGPGSCTGGNKPSGKSIDELSQEEQDAISDYTRGLSNQISSLILDGKLKDYEEPTNADSTVSPTKSTWNLIHTLDKAIESSKPLTPGTYYHGIDDGSKYVEGSDFKYKTFMSVTNDMDTASEFGPQESDEYSSHVLKINIPEGVKGIKVDPEYSGSDFPDMEESILPRDITLKVGKSYVEGNTKITEVDVVSSKQKENSTYLSDVFTFIKQNYRCKDGTVEEGSFKCGDNKNTKDKTLENTIKTITNKNQSNILSIPSNSKLGDNSKYLKALKVNLKYRYEYQKLVDQYISSSQESDKMFDDLRRKFGYDPNKPADLIKSMEDEVFLSEHKKLGEERNKVYTRIDKQQEYYKLKMYESRNEMIKEYTNEHLNERFDANQLTYNNKIPIDVEVSRYDDMTIVRDKKSPVSTDELYYKIHRMPSNLRGSISRVEVLDYEDPDNAYFAQMTGNAGFKADGCSGGSKITFFKQDDVSDWILTHEAAHSLDVRLSLMGEEKQGEDPDRAYRISEKNETWFQAMMNDVKFNKKHSAFVSDYAESYKGTLSFKLEDFADANAKYFTDHATFVEQYPNRAKVLDSLYKTDMDIHDEVLTDHIKAAIKGE